MRRGRRVEADATRCCWPPAWRRPRRERLLESLLKLVAIATVADVVPLTGENRVIVKRGLAGLRDVKNPGLRALLDVSGLTAGRRRPAPARWRSASRRASTPPAGWPAPSDVIEMFLTADPARARELAAQLHDLNQDRQQTEAEIARAIFEQCVRAAGDGRRCRAGVRGRGMASRRGGNRRQPRGGEVSPARIRAGHGERRRARLGAQHSRVSSAGRAGDDAGFVHASSEGTGRPRASRWRRTALEEFRGALPRARGNAADAGRFRGDAGDRRRDRFHGDHGSQRRGRAASRAVRLRKSRAGIRGSRECEVAAAAGHPQ